MESKQSSAFWRDISELLTVYPGRASDAVDKHDPAFKAARRARQSLDALLAESAPLGSLKVDHSVGKGLWTLVPWYGILDARVTKQASAGEYVVLHCISEGRPGVRMGLGVAANELGGSGKRLRDRALEVRRTFLEAGVERLRRAGFADVTAPGGRLTSTVMPPKLQAWDAGMIFELFCPAEDIEEKQAELTGSLVELIRVYQEWAGREQSRTLPIAPKSASSDLERLRERLKEGGPIWAISAGRDGKWWEEFRNRGVAAIGWKTLGDLSRFQTRDEAHAACFESRGGNPINDSLAAFDFAHEMAPGDVIMAKRGRSTFYALGEVVGPYQRNEDDELCNTRQVRWVLTGDRGIPAAARVPIKTLTNGTAHQELRAWLLSLLEDADVAVELDGDTGMLDEPYSVQTAIDEDGILLTGVELQRLVDLLRRKKNLLLSGPPGVGKTFLARRLAFLLMGRKSPDSVRMVQFHQSYSYEDFVQGIRPNESGQFVRKDGPFHTFCREATKDESKPVVFIIDEINRGNLSKIFGELMLLIEPDKRSREHAIPLVYSTDAGEVFHVPQNVHIIGTMNTADRSIAMVDYALRRRFAFATLHPRIRTEAFQSLLRDRGVSEALIRHVVDRIGALNETIAADTRELGPGFEIGHSYFCPAQSESELGANWFRSIIESEIRPLLQEYWFDDPVRVEREVEALLHGLGQ